MRFFPQGSIEGIANKVGRLIFFYHFLHLLGDGQGSEFLNY